MARVFFAALAVVLCAVASLRAADVDSFLGDRPDITTLDEKVYIGEDSKRDRNTFLTNWNGDHWPFCTNVCNLDTNTLRGDSICKLKTGEALDCFMDWYPVMEKKCPDPDGPDEESDGISCAQLPVNDVCDSQTP